MCSLGCQEEEDQYHIFEKCQLLSTEKEKIEIDLIFKDSARQKEAIEKLLIIETKRLKLIEALQAQPELYICE